MNASFEPKKQEQSRYSPRNESQSAISYPSRTLVHAKLEMTEPGDHDEQEADAVANTVMNGGKIARKISQGAGASSSIAVPPQMESQLSQLQGGGRQMPQGLRNMMENSFGRDFSQVRLHTDSEAATMSSNIHAKAFTHGNDIYFNHGQFSPETAEGQRLVAHELTHVVQGTGKVGRDDLSSYTPEQRRARMRWYEVWQNLNYCKSMAEDLMDKVEEQHWLFNLFDEFNVDFLLDSLREAEKHSEDLITNLEKIDPKNKEDLNPNNIQIIEEIGKAGLEILGVIRMVQSALEARRNNNIEAAGDWVTGLKIVKTAAFATAATIATGGLGGGVAASGVLGSIGINAAFGFGDSVLTEASKGLFGVSGGVKDAVGNIASSTLLNAIFGGYYGSRVGVDVAKHAVAGPILNELYGLTMGGGLEFFPSLSEERYEVMDYDDEYKRQHIEWRQKNHLDEIEMRPYDINGI